MAMKNKVVVGGSSVTAGQLEDLFRQIKDGSLGFDEVQAVLEHRNPWKEPKVKVETGYLRLISDGQDIVISATDGEQTIAQAKDMFPGFHDPDFARMDFKKGQPTPNISVHVYAFAKDGILDQFFGSLAANQVTLDQLCLSQSQIIRFVVDHSKWFRPNGLATFFLFKVIGCFFVARVGWFSCGLAVHLYHKSDTDNWRADVGHQLVVPKL
jgi:hypothetical protein